MPEATAGSGPDACAAAAPLEQPPAAPTPPPPAPTAQTAATAPPTSASSARPRPASSAASLVPPPHTGPAAAAAASASSGSLSFGSALASLFFRSSRSAAALAPSSSRSSSSSNSNSAHLPPAPASPQPQPQPQPASPLKHAASSVLIPERSSSVHGMALVQAEAHAAAPSSASLPLGPHDPLSVASVASSHPAIAATAAGVARSASPVHHQQPHSPEPASSADHEQPQSPLRPIPSNASSGFRIAGMSFSRHKPSNSSFDDHDPIRGNSTRPLSGHASHDKSAATHDDAHQPHQPHQTPLESSPSRSSFSLPNPFAALGRRSMSTSSSQRSNPDFMDDPSQQPPSSHHASASSPYQHHSASTSSFASSFNGGSSHRRPQSAMVSRGTSNNSLHLPPHPSASGPAPAPALALSPSSSFTSMGSSSSGNHHHHHTAIHSHSSHPHHNHHHYHQPQHHIVHPKRPDPSRRPSNPFVVVPANLVASPATMAPSLPSSSTAAAPHSASTATPGHSLVSTLSATSLTPVEPVKETRHMVRDYDPQTGNKMINNYMMLGELGRGMHGKVKLCVDTDTGERWAIKIVEKHAKRRRFYGELSAATRLAAAAAAAAAAATPGNGSGSGEGGESSGGDTALARNPQLEKIQREIAILKKCAHPHVVRLREVIDDPQSDKIYLVLEYLEGGDIVWQRTVRDDDASHGARGGGSLDPDDGLPADKGLDGELGVKTVPALSVDEARSVFRDLVSGVQYLHYQGIVHRDIKPANLLWSGGEPRRVKISDFGVSVFVGRKRGNRKPRNPAVASAMAGARRPKGQRNGGSGNGRTGAGSPHGKGDLTQLKEQRQQQRLDGERKRVSMSSRHPARLARDASLDRSSGFFSDGAVDEFATGSGLDDGAGHDHPQHRSTSIFGYVRGRSKHTLSTDVADARRGRSVDASRQKSFAHHDDMHDRDGDDDRNDGDDDDDDDDGEAEAEADELELAKTAGSPAFFAPELCGMGEIETADAEADADSVSVGDASTHAVVGTASPVAGADGTVAYARPAEPSSQGRVPSSGSHDAAGAYPDTHSSGPDIDMILAAGEQLESSHSTHHLSVSLGSQPLHSAAGAVAGSSPLSASMTAPSPTAAATDARWSVPIQRSGSFRGLGSHSRRSSNNPSATDQSHAHASQTLDPVQSSHPAKAASIESLTPVMASTTAARRDTRQSLSILRPSVAALAAHASALPMTRHSMDVSTLASMAPTSPRSKAAQAALLDRKASAHLGGVLGPPSVSTYAPPIGAPIDIWAMGVTLYCLVFGKVPFIADTEFELFNVIVRQPLLFPATPAIAGDLRHLFTRLLDKDPSQRITLDELRHHPWVTGDLTAAQRAAWLAETDPMSYAFGERLHVSDDDVRKAVTVMDRIRSRIRKISNSFSVLALAGLSTFRKRTHSMPGVDDAADPSAQQQQQQQLVRTSTSTPRKASQTELPATQHPLSAASSFTAGGGGVSSIARVASPTPYSASPTRAGLYAVSPPARPSFFPSASASVTAPAIQVQPAADATASGVAPTRPAAWTSSSSSSSSSIPIPSSTPAGRASMDGGMAVSPSWIRWGDAADRSIATSPPPPRPMFDARRPSTASGNVDRAAVDVNANADADGYDDAPSWQAWGSLPVDGSLVGGMAASAPAPRLSVATEALMGSSLATPPRATFQLSGPSPEPFDSPVSPVAHGDHLFDRVMRMPGQLAAGGDDDGDDDGDEDVRAERERVAAWELEYRNDDDDDDDGVVVHGLDND